MSATLEVEGRSLTLTNLEKVLWPAVGFTKEVNRQVAMW